MKTSKHTQGPWTRQNAIKIPWGTEKANVLTIENDNDTIVALSVLHGPFIDDVYDEEEAEANARLISAAPDMLEALELVFNEMDLKTKSQFNCFDKVKRAIAKARGDK